jgi:hypothetical protein
VICAACGLTRDPADLLAYWPRGEPERRHYVCRVTRPSPAAAESCFRKVVRSILLDEIGPAAPGPRIVIVGEAGPELVSAARA